VLAALASRPASTQVGATTDIITGAVAGPDSQPVAGAIVQATSVETRVSRQRTTDAHGRFTIVFPDGGGRYELTARFIGMAPVQISVVRQADEDRIVANIRMGLLAVPLEPVTVRAPSGARNDRTGPGSTGSDLNPERVLRLAIDASDLNNVATLAPGVLAIGGNDSTAPAISVAGQRPTANNVTLDGMSFGSGSVPQDAIRSIRVVTNTYDVARGQFSGGLITSSTRSGTNVPQGSVTYALRDRSLAWGHVTSSPFGQGSTQNQLGGAIGGPLVRDRLFVFAALQGRWREQALPSLATADPSTLVRLGVSPDSVARFVALAGATGAPVAIPDRYADRATSDAVGLLRVDWQLSDLHTVTVRLDGRWESQEPSRVSPLALPLTGGTRTERGGGVMASLTSYLGESFINELRGYIARQRREASAFLALPAARVEVASALPDGGQSIAALAFGGNSGLPQRRANRSVELADELSWVSGGASHRLKLGAYVYGTRVVENETPNQFGTFVFPSLAALAADSPATFTRTLAPLEQAGTAWTNAFYLGDTWRAAGGLQLTYGVRMEAGRFSGAPPYNRAVDSLFAVRTDRIPSDVHASPRVGFTWEFGGGQDAASSTYLRGGVGDFRSPTPTSLYSAALAASGLSGAERDLMCVGTGVPTPDWSRYGADPSAIPFQCADTVAAVSVTPRPSVTVFAPAFTAPHAWRASLGVVQRFQGNYWVTLEGTYARGMGQYGFRDLNLVATPRFLLPDEADRPVYVPADSIVPATGALSSAGSRIHPAFGNVLLMRSDLQSDTRQVRVSVAGATARGASFRMSYTLTRSRDQSSFACCAAASGFATPTTAGDPNTLEWATSDYERRHSLLGTVSYPVTSALEITAIGRITSGMPFTPLVGSDINGDGARNDRAFIFDPATTTDTAVAAGMRALTAAAPAPVRACLARQLDRSARRNSCTGPWQPSLDFQVNWRPAGLGLNRRLTMSLFTVNLLGGLDQWVHGAAHLRGWGYAAGPDPVLLYVRTFDPATRRFRYAVNGRFGATASATGGVTVPFQIALQARLAIGLGRTGERRRGAARQAPVAEPPVVPRNPVTAILELRDALGCTPEQAAHLRAISDSLDALNRVLSDSMDAAVQQAGDRSDPGALFTRLGPMLAAARDNLQRALERARGVLTLEQWSMLPDALKADQPATND